MRHAEDTISEVPQDLGSEVPAPQITMTHSYTLEQRFSRKEPEDTDEAE